MEILNNIGFDWQVALANFVSFIIIWLIVSKWVVGPVMKTIKDRKQLISNGLQNAEQSKKELEGAEKQAQEIIKESKKSANEIIAKAKNSGDEMILKATQDAQTQAGIVATRAKESLKKEQEDAERELLGKTAKLVSLGVQKILQEDLDEEKNDKLTQRALADFSKTRK